MLLDFLKSFGQLTKHLLLGKQPDVVLYYPQHFNRSEKGTNPFFDPIVEVCKENGINYLLLEEPDFGTSYPRASQCVKADAFFWIVIIIRKLMHIVYKEKTTVEIDTKIAHILDSISFHKLRADRYIVISNSMLDVLGELNPKGVVYDYQHGIIYKGHPGYFLKDDILTASYFKSNRRILVWGTLYKKAFEKALSKETLDKRIKVVGYPIQAPALDLVRNNKEFVVISLQITSDEEMWYKHSPLMLYECLEQFKGLGCKVLLKHHPRFNNEFDFSDISSKYPFAEFTTKPLLELVSIALLHITWSSTTSFEYANYGVPTYFLIDSILHYGQTIFYKQYYYPLYKDMSLVDVISRISNTDMYVKDCMVIDNWYKSVYAPFDKNKILKILTGNED